MSNVVLCEVFNDLDHMDFAYCKNYALFQLLQIRRVCLVSRHSGWYRKGLHWNPILSGNDFNSYVLENTNFVEIRFVSRTPHEDRVEKVRMIEVQYNFLGKIAFQFIEYTTAQAILCLTNFRCMSNLRFSSVHST